MEKLITKTVWAAVAGLYVELAIRCVQLWDGGAGAATLGAQLPHMLVLPLVITAGVGVVRFFQDNIFIDKYGAAALRKVIYLTIGIFIYVYGLMLTPQKDALSFQRMVIGGVGIFLMILGFLMPKLPRNRIAGVRYSWTLADPLVWQLSNRVGGIYTTVMGAFFCISAVLTKYRPNVFTKPEITVIILYIIALTVHSRIIATRVSKAQKED